MKVVKTDKGYIHTKYKKCLVCKLSKKKYEAVDLFNNKKHYLLICERELIDCIYKPYRRR